MEDAQKTIGMAQKLSKSKQLNETSANYGNVKQKSRCTTDYVEMKIRKNVTIMILRNKFDTVIHKRNSAM